MYIGTVPLSSQINPVHTLPQYNFKIHFNIILALSQGPFKCPLLSDFPTEILVCITYIFHAFYVPLPPHRPWCYHLSNTI